MFPESPHRTMRGLAQHDRRPASTEAPCVEQGPTSTQAQWARIPGNHAAQWTVAHQTRGLSDIGAEAALLAGGGRAILLQLANPAVGHAVAQHSDFATDPLRRLRNTLTYVYALVYGTPDQVAAVRAMVRRAHEPVRSPDYDASDARLQLWVAATLYETASMVHERIFGALDEASAEAVYRDYAVVGTALGMPTTLWPVDRAAFRDYWDSQLPGLEVDDTVRAVSVELLHPTAGPFWLRAAMPLARLATAGLLSPTLREAYAMPWNARRQRRFDLLMTVTARVYPRLPGRLRHWPKDHYLRALG
jgi:uncharacterized protein (DUF2236 family)